MTMRKFDIENRPLQRDVVFGGCHTSASENAFACGLTGTIFVRIMHK